GFRIDTDRVGVAQGLQLFGRSQQQFFDDEACDFVNSRPRLVASFRRECGQLEVEALQFGPTYEIEMLPERDDGWNRAPRSQPPLKPVQLVGRRARRARRLCG